MLDCVIAAPCRQKLGVAAFTGSQRAAAASDAIMTPRTQHTCARMSPCIHMALPGQQLELSQLNALHFKTYMYYNIVSWLPDSTSTQAAGLRSV